MENKKEYITPQLTVVAVKSERGYATSTLTSLALWSSITFPETQMMERYETTNGWGEGNSTFWN